MTFARQVFLLDTEYSAWATRRLLDACSALSREEMSRDFAISHRSIILTLYHFFVSERFWTECLVTNAVPPLDEVEDAGVPSDPHLEELARDWPPIWNRLCSWLSALDEEDLPFAFSTRLPDGSPAHFARWQLLRQIVNHSTLHRGQVVGMIRMLGKQPPNVDIMTFYHLRAGQAAIFDAMGERSAEKISGDNFTNFR